MLPLLPPAPCKPLAEEECTKLFIDFGKTTRLVGRSCEPIEKQEACSSKLRSNRKTRGLQFEAPIQSKTRCLQLDAAIHSENTRLAARSCDPIEKQKACSSKMRSNRSARGLQLEGPIRSQKHEACSSKLRSNRNARGLQLEAPIRSEKT